MRHLGLGEWHRVVLHDEVDAIGPLARTRLVAHGVLWPPNLAGDVPLIEAVPGGSLIDGEGGDEVLGDTWHRVAELQQLVRAPWPLRKRRCGTPSSLRSRTGPDVRRPWTLGRPADVAPGGRSRTRARGARPLRGAPPAPFSVSLQMVPRRRRQVLAARNRALLVAPYGVEISSPLLHPDVVHALAQQGGALGPGDRTAVLRDLVPDLFPDEVLGRTSKAVFQVLHGSAHAESPRTGRGRRRPRAGRRRRPAAVVGARAAAPTAALLQSAWLAGDGRTVQQR